MTRFTLLTLHLIAVLSSIQAYMDTPNEGEDEIVNRELQESGGTAGFVGDVCNGNNPCSANLDCARFGFRRRCMPVTCAVQALKETISQTGFDLEGYGKFIMDQAGVSMESQMFRQLPDAGLNLIDRHSDDAHKLLQAMKDNQPPIHFFEASFNNCTGGINSIMGRADSKQAANPGLTPYFGGSWELGALGTYNGDIFYGQGTADAVGLGLVNNCFGFVLGYDAGISGLFGLGFTDALSSIANGCKQMFPVADFPPFGLQMGFVATEPPIFLIESTAGASASAGFQGYTSCTTDVL